MEQAHASERHPARLAGWLVFVLLLTSLNYLGRFLDTGGDTGDIAYRWATTVAIVVQFGVMLGILLLIASGLPKRELFALRRPSSWKRALALGAGVLVAIFAAQAAYVGLLHALGAADPSDEQGLVPEEWDPDRIAPLISFVLLASVLVPIVEELTFRGLGFSLLLPWGAWAAVLGTAALFGLAHGLLVGLPVLVFFGLGVGWLRKRTASVYPCMVVHGAYNGLALAIALTQID